MAHVSISEVYTCWEKMLLNHNKEYSYTMTSWHSDTCDQLLLLLMSIYREYGPPTDTHINWDVCVHSIYFPFVVCFSSQIFLWWIHENGYLSQRPVGIPKYVSYFGYAPNSLHKVVQSPCARSCVYKCMVATYTPMWLIVQKIIWQTLYMYIHVSLFNVYSYHQYFIYLLYVTFLCFPLSVHVHVECGSMYSIAFFLQLDGPNVYPGVPHDYTNEVIIHVPVHVHICV